MRCPKCGYTSFDHLESCKKCGKDLLEFKERFGIKSVLFPGQMSASSPAESSYDTDVADAAVAAATMASAASAPAAAEDVAAQSSDSDDFGFDFMGDSAEDDDLSFDELFEEAPEDEDIEETIEGPTDQADAGEEAFSFDLPDEDEELESDFGFDPASEEEQEDESFAFADDEPVDKSQGAGEGPKSPFDLPESSVVEGAPVIETAVAAAANLPDPPVANDQPADLPLPSAQAALDSFELAGVENSALHRSDGVSEVEADLLETEEPVTDDSSFAVPEAQEDRSASVVAAPALSAPASGQDRVSVTRRFGACLGDVILLGLVGTSFIVVAEMAMSADAARLFPTIETLIDLSVPYFLVMFFLAFGYFTLFHFLVGQTPGKMLAGIRVETTEGQPLTFAHAFLRSVGGLLQLLPLGLGYLMVLFRADGCGWNDRLAGTRTINLKD